MELAITVYLINFIAFSGYLYLYRADIPELTPFVTREMDERTIAYINLHRNTYTDAVHRVIKRFRRGRCEKPTIRLFVQISRHD